MTHEGGGGGVKTITCTIQMQDADTVHCTFEIHVIILHMKVRYTESLIVEWTLDLILVRDMHARGSLEYIENDLN